MATAQTPHKILRIGVIQGGKIIEERIVKKRETVTIGHAPRNTIVIPISSLPASFEMFEMKSTGYVLRFTDAMVGRLASGENQLDFAALKAQGLARHDRDAYAVPLTDASKGKISFGEVTLLFQFVSPPPETPRPVLPEIARGSLWHTMDKVFFAILLGCVLFDFGPVTAITLRDPRPDQEVTFEDLPDRFAKMIIPDRPIDAPKKKEEVQQAENEKKADNKNENKPKSVKPKGPVTPEDAQARREAIAKGVATKGLLKMLGAVGGDSNGAIEDVLGSGSGSSEIASALQGAGGVGVATADELAGAGRKGGGSGQAAAIGDLGTSGGAGHAGAFAEKKVAAVSGRVIDQGPEVESTNCDRDAISRYVKRNLRAIQACYERELKRNVSLKGKIVLRFTISGTGRVAGLPEVEEDTLGNEAVVSCIRNTIRMWMFPIKDNECPVAYPFVFAPAS